MTLDIVRVEGLKVPEPYLMEIHQNGHDLARIQLPVSPSLPCSTCQQFTLPLWEKLLAEIIDVAEQFE
jgi:hypothetical protein